LLCAPVVAEDAGRGLGGSRSRDKFVAVEEVNGRPSRRLPQVVLFALVGATNTLIDFTIFSTLRVLDVPVLFANMASTSTTMIFSFIVNRRFVFGAGQAPVQRQVVLFFVGTAFGMYVLHYLALVGMLRIVPEFPELAASMHKHLGIGESAARTLLRSVSAKVGATLVSLVWNFFFYRRVVFAGAPAVGDSVPVGAQSRAE
jgi:putative flippase GtrA